MVLPLILIAFFFCAFIVVLNSTFPGGASLSSMLRSGGLLGGDSLPSNPLLPELLSGGPSRVPEPLVARMTSLERAVRQRTGDSVAWTGAYQGMPLMNRSAVQTLAASNAVLDFEGESRLILGENTLAVVRKFERDPVSREKRAVVLVLNGELRGTIAPQHGDKVRMHVTTGSAEGHILGTSSAPGREAVFRVAENPDHSSTFSVYQGEAEVVAQGRTVHVSPGHTVTVHPSRPPGEPTRLPDAPAPSAPDDGAIFSYRNAPPPVEFEWGAMRLGSSYRVEIARDRSFSDVVQRAEVKPNSFYHGNLPEGDYWWRVAVLQDWAESPPSAARQLRILKDLEPPALRVDFPADVVPAAAFVLSGSSEPGARVFLAGQEVAADSRGAFEFTLALGPGVHPVVVQAMDTAGNVSHSSAFLTAESR